MSLFYPLFLHSILFKNNLLESNAPAQLHSLNDFSVFEAADAMKEYIKAHMNLFFTKKFRQNFTALASMTKNNAIDDLKILRLLFTEMNIENKTRVIFIFDHILM